MSIKDFNTLYGLDLTPYISKKPVFKYDRNQGRSVQTGQKLDYLNWADVVVLLHESGAESVRFGNSYAPGGHSVFLACENLPEVHVWVEIDGDRREITYPVIEGTRDVTMEKIAQSDIHNASQRAMVKCVAVNWGLGLKLWQKEELLPKEPPLPADAESVYDRLRRKANTAAARAGGATELAGRIGYKKNEIEKILAASSQVAELEAKLDEVMRHDPQ